jgi:hypothetical protein
VVCSHPLEQPKDCNVLAVMLCATAEVLMEDLLKDVLFHQNARFEHIEILLDSHWGRRRQMELFRKLCGQSMKDAIHSLRKGAVFDAWERIANCRNKFVHGTPPGEEFKHFPREEDLRTVRDNLPDMFCALHNEFAA